MSLLLVFCLITLVSAAPLPQNDSDSRFTFTTPEIFNFTFTTLTPANASPNDTVANDAGTVPVSTVQASQGTIIEVDTTVPPVVLQDSGATVASDASVQSVSDQIFPTVVLMNLTQNDASADQGTSTTAPMPDQTETTIVPIVQYDRSTSTVVPILLNDVSQTVDLDGTTGVPMIPADPTATTPAFVDSTGSTILPNLVQDISAPIVLNSSDTSINYVARDAASQDGTNIVPIVTYASDTTVQVVTVQPNQEDTMASINVVPVMANPSTDSPVVLSEITVVPLDSSAFQNTEVPVVTDSSATSTASVEADVARDAPVEPSLSSATFAPVPVVNNDVPVVVPIVSTDSTKITSDSVTGQSVEEPLPVVNVNPVLADPAEQPLVDPIISPVQDPSTLPPQPQISEQQPLPSDQQQLDFVNYQQADPTYNTAYQYLNLTESQAQNLILNISLPVSPQSLLSRLSRTAEQMNYEGKLDVALQLTAMAHNLMTEVDSDLERRN